MKTLWFDVETTGLSAYKDEIIQIAGLVEVDGETVQEFDIKMAPSLESVTQRDFTKALKVQGRTIEEVQEWQSQDAGWSQIKVILNKYIDKWNKGDKFIAGGHNVQFDMDFLSAQYKKNIDKWFGSYFSYAAICTRRLADILEYESVISPKNKKLETLCELFKIELSGAHDALVDINATRKLYNAMMKKLSEERR